jgi:enoyl-CoA hydratase/carnithine racemase
MGLIPGAGGIVSVPRRIGRHRAAYLALAGRRVPTDQALSWDLIDEIRPV